jgi:hypothetical protein
MGLSISRKPRDCKASDLEFSRVLSGMPRPRPERLKNTTFRAYIPGRTGRLIEPGVRVFPLVNQNSFPALRARSFMIAKNTGTSIRT